LTNIKEKLRASLAYYSFLSPILKKCSFIMEDAPADYQFHSQYQKYFDGLQNTPPSCTNVEGFFATTYPLSNMLRHAFQKYKKCYCHGERKYIEYVR
jgi:hypothetical protein